MKKIVIVSMELVALAAVVLIGVLSLTQDKKEPRIQIDQNKIAYAKDCGDDVLLAGVTAVDDEDGDVTDTLMVTKRARLSGGDMEAVQYAASDDSGNVATADVIYMLRDDGQYSIVMYDQYHVDMDSLEISIDGTNVNGKVSGEIQTEPFTTDAEDGTDGGQEPASDKPDVEEPTTSEPEEPTSYVSVGGKPAIVLNQTEITVNAGSEINWMQYVEEIYDDKDERSELFKRVSLTENIDTNIPGDYIQGLVCTDLEQNISEPAKITVHIVTP